MLRRKAHNESMRKVVLYFDTSSQLGTMCRLFVRAFPEYGVLPFVGVTITTARHCRELQAKTR